jgi:pentatricopeptide repeat protein
VWAFLQKIKNGRREEEGDTTIVGLHAYTTVVDAYARGGNFERAMAVIEGQACLPTR